MSKVNNVDEAPVKYAGNEEKGTKVKKGEDDNAFVDSQNRLFLDYTGDLKKRANIAVYGFFISFLGMLGAIGWHLANPVKESVPYVLRVDTLTGAVDMMTTVKDQPITQNKAVDSYFVAEFVRNFEGYNFNTIQTTYDRTIAMSDLAVQAQFKKMYSGDYARHTLFGNTGNIQVEITSVILDGTDQVPVARVRFKTTTTKAGNTSVDYYIATVGYKYDLKAMSTDSRLLNPLGFTVVSYTVSKEVAPT